MKNKDIEFNIFGTPYKLEFKESRNSEDEWCYGTFNYARKDINISEKLEDGTKLPQREINLSKMHELVHAICCEGQYFKINEDEPFIEWMAKCLISLKEQGVI